MFLSISNRALLQGVVASALVMAGTSACSRSDRTESGSDNSAVMQDTMTTTPGAGTATGTGFESDTAGTTGTTPESGAAIGDTAPAQIQQDAPRAATAAPSAESQDTALEGDSVAAGYRPMQPDTLTVPESDSARVTEDTSGISADTSGISADTSGISADTSVSLVADTASIAVGVDTAADTSAMISDTATIAVDTSADISDTSWAEMARDTTTTADQIDTTAAAASGEVAVQATADTGWADTAGDTTEAGVSGNISVGAVETADSAGPIRPAEDSTELLGEVTTNDAGEVAVADTLESDRIRPPEDSTELHGNAISDETADEREFEAGEREVVSASESRTDEVGAAALAGTVTGAEAVALLTRQGASCIVVDPETNEAVRWDMSRTPITLNPCGLGSMNLTKVRTAGSGLQE